MAETKETKAKAYDPEELVEIELFADGGKYKDDVFVQVNGETCLIQRGVPVKVKRKFYDVLIASRRQESANAREFAELSK